MARDATYELLLQFQVMDDEAVTMMSLANQTRLFRLMARALKEIEHPGAISMGREYLAQLLRFGKRVELLAKFLEYLAGVKIISFRDGMKASDETLAFHFSRRYLPQLGFVGKPSDADAPARGRESRERRAAVPARMAAAPVSQPAIEGLSADENALVNRDMNRQNAIHESPESPILLNTTESDSIQANYNPRASALAAPADVVEGKLRGLGICRRDATMLVREFGAAACLRQAEWLNERVSEQTEPVRSPAGLLIAAIREGYAAPKAAAVREQTAAERARLETERSASRERARGLAAAEQARKEARDTFLHSLPEDERQRLADAAISAIDEPFRERMRSSGGAYRPAERAMFEHHMAVAIDRKMQGVSAPA